jgi:PPOX class probable F420-dependent enzyme
VDHKTKRTRQLRRIVNIRATGHACLLVDAYREDWSALWWVRLDGRGRVVDDPGELARAGAALVAKYPQYAESPPAGPTLAIDVTTWTAWSAS